MKKTIFSIIVVLFFGTSIFAQGKLGVRFFNGYQFQSSESKYLISNNHVEYNLNLTNISNSQSVGLFSHFDFGYLFLEPEVLYTTYSVQYSGSRYDTESSSEFSVTERVQQVDLPINAGINIKNVRIGCGPVFHVLKNNKSDLVRNSSIENISQTLTAGFQGSIGYSWKIFHADIRYQKEFNSLTDHLVYNNQKVNLSSTFSSLQFGIAVALDSNIN